jgi:hypothetical protein
MKWLSHNYSLVEFERNNKIVIGGVEMMFDDFYNQYHNAPRFGKAIEGRFKGRYVYFEAMAYTRINQGDSWMNYNEKLIISDVAVVFSVGDDGIRVENNYCLLSPEVKKGEGFDVDSVWHDRGVVKFHDDDSIVGHVVVFRPYRNIKIEEELFSTFAQMYYMRQKDLVYDTTDDSEIGEWRLVSFEEKDNGGLLYIKKVQDYVGVCMDGSRVMFRKTKQFVDGVDGIKYSVVNKNDIICKLD